MPAEKRISQESETASLPVIRFTVAEDAFDPETFAALCRTAVSLNRLADVVSLLHDWSRSQLAWINTSVPPQVKKEKLLLMGRQILAWKSVKDAASKALDPACALESVSDTDIKRLADEMGLTSWPSAGTETIVIATDEEIGELEARLSVVPAISHDSSSPVTSIYGFLELIRLSGEVQDQYLSFIGPNLLRAAETSSFCMDLLKNPYPSEEIPLTIFIDEIAHGTQAGRIDLKLPSVVADIRLIWSESWMGALVSNLIQNMMKAASVSSLSKLEGFVDFQLVEQDGQQLVRVDIEDRGPGFPSDFAGFAPGFTKWGSHEIARFSNGMGMWSQLKAIREHYGGDILAQNVVVDDRVIGAKVSVLLPATIYA